MHVALPIVLFPQVVNILGTGDEGWWKGELEGKEGVLPDNFVQLIPLYKPSSMQCLIIAKVITLIIILLVV